MKRKEAWPAQTRKARRERAKRGWAVEDTWNLDSYLSHVLADALKEIRDYPGHPGSVEAEEWKAIVEQMIAGFAAWRDHNDLETAEEDAAAYEKVQASLRLMTEWFGHLWT
jgi:hypothetical protein